MSKRLTIRLGPSARCQNTIGVFSLTGPNGNGTNGNGRTAKGTFAPGNKVARGRRGNRNKLSEAFLADFHDTWRKHGKKALDLLAATNPGGIHQSRRRGAAASSAIRSKHCRRAHAP
jgi:hypothetical protein